MATEQATPYAELCRYLGQTATLGSVSALAHWDQETYMPPRAAAGRATQASAMATLLHERMTSPRLGELLDACERAALADHSPEAANVRDARRDYIKATKLPPELVAELAETASRSQEVWKKAREASDFAQFQPWLERMIDLSRRKAECLAADGGTAPDGELYDALLDEYEPRATARDIEKVFAPLRDRLSTFVAELLDSGSEPDDAPISVNAPSAGQHELGHRVLRAMGFDLSAGRLDTTTHPFCTGIGPGDVRLTTRYRENRFTDALYGTMHEGGHGLYEQGLPTSDAEGEPDPLFGTPLAQSVSLGIHESQSRMWENFVGRGRAFWAWLKPIADETLGATKQSDAEALYRASNRVERSFIRVEADEATYNLHVMLRFELERALIRGDLAVADLPGAWNERFEALIGAKVPDDTHGCLQDVHWSFGLLGYFPTYTLGNLYAAQFFEAIKEQTPDLDDRIAGGDFSAVLAWNREHIHAHGRRYTAADLCERATGSTLSAEPLMRHLEGKLRPVYGLD